MVDLEIRSVSWLSFPSLKWSSDNLSQLHPRLWLDIGFVTVIFGWSFSFAAWSQFGSEIYLGHSFSKSLQEMLQIQTKSPVLQSSLSCAATIFWEGGYQKHLSPPGWLSTVYSFDSDYLHVKMFLFAYSLYLICGDHFIQW